jgi:branched-chain amino acid transport system substrate-binding protein
MNWDVPIVGQTTLGSGQTKALLKKPEYWEKVYPNNFRNCSYDDAGKLPPRTVAFVERIRKAGIDMSDTLLWWIALGYDGPRLIAEAIKEAGTEPKAIAAYWNKVSKWPGVYATITFTPELHDGFQSEEIIMCRANSLKEGAFTLAPGYTG